MAHPVQSWTAARLIINVGTNVRYRAVSNSLWIGRIYGGCREIVKSPYSAFFLDSCINSIDSFAREESRVSLAWFFNERETHCVRSGQKRATDHLTVSLDPKTPSQSVKCDGFVTRFCLSVWILRFKRTYVSHFGMSLLCKQSPSRSTWSVYEFSNIPPVFVGFSFISASLLS